MNEFWTNISRYPRFFISSLTGLILIIVSPLRNLFKIKRFRIGIIILLISMFSIIFVIVKSMTGL